MQQLTNELMEKYQTLKFQIAELLHFFEDENNVILGCYLQFGVDMAPCEWSGTSMESAQEGAILLSKHTYEELTEKAKKWDNRYGNNDDVPF